MAFKELVILFGVVQVCIGAVSKLKTYNVDANTVTVSGISSGGAMSTQFHFIYSKDVKGAGIFASGPYLCGYGGISAVACMTAPGSQNVQSFINRTNDFAATGKIDPVSNIIDSKVYIFHGINDTVVNQGSGKNLKLMYDNYKANVHAEFGISAGHGQPVDKNGYGGPCGSVNPLKKFINECAYDGAYEMFKWMYGDNIVKPEVGYVAPIANLLSYDQREFFTPSLTISLAQSGLLYVPTACKSNETQACRFHIAFHGCLSNQQAVGTDYATKTQYIEVAELNNIIVLFPQTANSLIQPSGCWDMFGYSGLTTYGTKSGPQSVAVRKMMKRVLGA